MSEYTRPKLREKLKERIQQGTKGGKAGQWSARKAQLLASEYEREGGGYRGKKKKTQKHLDAWTKEKWTTSDGSKAVRANKTKRYLPAKAGEKLTPAEKKRTEKKKQAASKTGKQYVSNTPAAKKARKKASRSTTEAKRPAKPASKKKKSSRSPARKVKAKKKTVGRKKKTGKRATRRK